MLKLGGAPLEIQGRLLTADGTPAGGASIANLDQERLDTLELFSHHFEFGFDDFPGGGGGSGGNWGTRSSGNVTSDDGGFTVGGLRPGRYRLRFSDGRTGIELVADPIEAGSRDLELRLPSEERIARIAGVVVTLSGAPLEGVDVGLQANGSSQNATTDRSGAFEFRDVLRRSYELVVAPDGFTSRVTHDLSNERDLEHLRFVAVRRCHVQVDLTDSSLDADRFEIRDARDQPLAILLQQGGGAIGGPNWRLNERKSPALAVTEDAATLVLFRGDGELRRIPLRLTPSELTIVRP